MPTSVEPLILDLLDWLGPNARPYAEVMDAWRTSCPGLPVWEEANNRGFLEQFRESARGVCVSVSALGVEFLRSNGR